jgi:hypothetical protein
MNLSDNTDLSIGGFTEGVGAIAGTHYRNVQRGAKCLAISATARPVTATPKQSSRYSATATAARLVVVGDALDGQMRSDPQGLSGGYSFVAPDFRGFMPGSPSEIAQIVG